MTKPTDLDCGPPPGARRDLDGQAHNGTIERRFGYSARAPRSPTDLPRVGPDQILHNQIADLRHALAVAECRILELEQELSINDQHHPRA